MRLPSEKTFVRVAQGAHAREAELAHAPSEVLAGAPLPSPAPGPPTGERPVALFVAHGMGQQVPFETLDQVVSALRGAHARKHLTMPDARVRQIQRGTDRVARVEMTIGPPEGHRRELHIYEGYWAPLTEGQISLRETFWFLVTAGLSGIGRCLEGRWWRLMFDRRQIYPLKFTTALAFTAVLIILSTLGFMNALIAAVTASRLLGHGGGWPTGNLLADLSCDFVVCLVAVLILLWLGVARVAAQRRHLPSGSIQPADQSATWWGWVCVRGAGVTLVAVGALILYHLIRHYHADAPPMWARTWLGDFFSGFQSAHAPIWQVLPMLGVWASVAALSWKLRGLVLEYVGDVAIYVSSHTVNRFWATRDAIQSAVMRIVRFIYHEPDETGGAPLYDQVLIVGHSLGSVIAYDSLNAMIREDLTGGGELRVLDRTPLLLTFGSPLDKTAFLFRNQAKSVGDVREGLAESMQPMIAADRTRPKRWVNLWSPNDIISGSLDYYDDDEKPHNQSPNVENRVDPQATTPLLAHNEYWDGAMMSDVLYEAILAH